MVSILPFLTLFGFLQFSKCGDHLFHLIGLRLPFFPLILLEIYSWVPGPGRLEYPVTTFESRIAKVLLTNARQIIEACVVLFVFKIAEAADAIALRLSSHSPAHFGLAGPFQCSCFEERTL